MSVQGAMEMEIGSGAGDQPGVAEARERVRDRRSLGRDELADQPVGQRQRQADAGRLDPPPLDLKSPVCLGARQHDGGQQPSAGSQHHQPEENQPHPWHVGRRVASTLASMRIAA